MKKATFICKNVDARSSEEVILCESLLKIGFEVNVYETDVFGYKKPNLESIVTEGDLVIISTDKENGFLPVVTRKAKCYRKIIFEIH